MKNLIIAEIERTLYGVWEDEALKSVHVPKFHMFPMSPEHYCGMAELEGSMSSLYDLGACLGHPRMDISAGGHGIILSTEGRPRGFGVNRLLGAAEYDPGSVIMLPKVLRSEAFSGCLIHEGRPVIIVHIKLLHDLAIGEDWRLPLVSLEDPATRQLNPESIRLISANEVPYAMDDSALSDAIALTAQPMHLPLAPSFVEGVALRLDGTISAAINLSAALGEPVDMEGTQYIPTRDGELLIHINKDIGTAGAFDIRRMPRIAACSAFSGAVVADGAAYALIDADALSRRIARPDVEGIYADQPEIIESFGKQDLKTQEFELIGDVFALPSSQVEDVIDIRPYTLIPGSRSIVVGIAELDDEVLPVLDLALCFGLDSKPDPYWKMIKIADGDFKALLLTQAAHDENTVGTERQFHLPIRQSYRYVFGCYTAQEKVRLLLNVAALAVHFDLAHVSHVFDSLHKRPKPELEIQSPSVVREASNDELIDETESISVEPAQDEKALNEAVSTHAAAKSPDAQPDDERAGIHQSGDMIDGGESGQAADKADADAYEGAPQSVALDEYLEEEPEIQAAADAGRGHGYEPATAEYVNDEPRSVVDELEDQQELMADEEVEAPLYEQDALVTPARRGSPEAITNTAAHSSVPAASKRSKSRYSGLIALVIIFMLLSLAPFGYYTYMKKAPDRPLPEIMSLKPVDDRASAPVAPEPAPEKPAEQSEAAPQADVADAPVAEKPVEVRITQKDDGGLLIEVPEDIEPYSHRVRRGDTLWHISGKYTGNPFNYPIIANENEIRNPDLIFPGQRVEIRPLEKPQKKP